MDYNEASLDDRTWVDLSEDDLDRMIAGLDSQIITGQNSKFKIIPEEQLEAYLAVSLEARIQILEEKP
jgi:hypothetical protein